MWSVLIPFKGAPGAKSRLAADGLEARARAELAEAFLLDVLAAAGASPQVTSLAVVTPATSKLPALNPEIRILREPSELTGLNGAIAWGLEALASEPGFRAVVTGDLPYLTAEQLNEVLALAEAHPLSFVPDAQDTGTAMLLLRDQTTCIPAFGAGSRDAHEQRGFVPLALSRTSGARSDVDTLDQLTSSSAPLGAATSAVLRSLALS